MDTLIKDIATLKNYINAEGSSALKNVSPSALKAERNYIVKVIGDAVYANLLDGVKNNNLTVDETTLLNEVLMAEAPLAYYLGIPIQQVRFGDTGLHTATTDSTQQLTKWMYDEFRTQLLIDGYNAIDNLYQYMEKQTGADWYAAWTSDEAFTGYKELFVNNVKIFSATVEIKASRWLFSRIIPTLRLAEAFFIIPAIGTDFFGDLKTKFRNGTATLQEKNAIGVIQNAISLMAYSRALTDPMFVNELIVVTATKTDNVKAPDVKPYYELSEQYKQMAESALNLLLKYLNEDASPTVFIPYYTSEFYTDPAKSSLNTNFDNTRPGNQGANSTFFF